MKNVYDANYRTYVRTHRSKPIHPSIIMDKTFERTQHNVFSTKFYLTYLPTSYIGKSNAIFFFQTAYTVNKIKGADKLISYAYHIYHT